ncbi:MAG: amidohydrolase [bacterium]|nr:amidohydrolase [bacterium]
MTFRRITLILILLAGCLLAGCQLSPEPAVEPADLVLVGGKIVTVDDSHPEAEALAARGDTIVAVGSRREIEPYVGPATEVIEIEGRLAIPGFIDGHGHFMGLGDSRLQLDLGNAASWDEIVAMVAEAVATSESGQWIRGHGWHQDKWDEVPSPHVEGFPLHDGLSAVSSENPVLLTHASGHALFANAKAMELAGVDATTPDPPGGDVLKDDAGRPTGLFRETAESLIVQAYSSDSRSTPAEARRMAELASQECLAKGVTSFHDAGVPFETIDFLKQAADEGILGIRLWVMVRGTSEGLAEKLPEYRTTGYADRHLTVGGIKLLIDGALGSRGAWLLEPYTDSPESIGLQTVPTETLREVAELAIEHGYQLCTHAIGDRANRVTLDVYEETFKAHPEKQDLRWRIEHAQHIDPEDIPRFAELGVVAAMQGVHCTSDGPWVPDRLGERRTQEGAYVWQKLLQSGATVINGTDVPVEDVDPIANYYASVSRRLKDGTVFYPDQRMGRLEALKSYTLDAARAVFEEDVKGSLEVGKLADVTVLSQDILTVAEEEIPQTEVLYTIVGGKVAYRGE